jgi:hypothetical protein
MVIHQTEGAHHGGRCLNSTQRRMQMKTKTNVKAGYGQGGGVA